ncbi:MAG TPA: hypothetical protein VGH61_04540 [Steroidobacteraceae bacterium]|jgi:hypothetical protein
MKGLAHNLGLFAGSAERRYARRASEQMLDLFQRERRERPELSGRALYEAVAARRLGDKPRISAAEVVRRAEESFADWPAERAVRFRDVVHYLIFDEYTHAGKAREATRTNMGAVVARVIPEEL